MNPVPAEPALSYPTVELAVPPWAVQLIGDPDRAYPRVEDRMALAVALAARSVAEGGGPFGAAVFDEAGRLVAPGINQVVASSCSVAHAEVVALAVAQKKLGTFDLGGPELGRMELTCSAEPCAQCFGAILWSGVRRVVCGARSEDAESIGFDEGPKPRAWVEELEGRGITVERDVLRDEAARVLSDYGAGGGPVYNSRSEAP